MDNLGLPPPPAPGAPFWGSGWFFGGAMRELVPTPPLASGRAEAPCCCAFSASLLSPLVLLPALFLEEDDPLGTPLFLSPLKNLNLSNIEFLLLAPAPKADLDAPVPVLVAELLFVEELAPDAVEAHELVLVALTRRPPLSADSEPGARRLLVRPPGVGMLDVELLGDVDREVLTDSRLVALLGMLLPPAKTQKKRVLK